MINDYGVLESRGYEGTISYSVADNVWHGKIVGISDLVTYEADSYEELVEEFKDAVCRLSRLVNKVSSTA